MSRKNRKRINVMIDVYLLEKLNELIPIGERSNFANTAFEEALVQFSREKAFLETDKLRQELKIKLPNDEDLIKEIRYGLE